MQIYAGDRTRYLIVTFDIVEEEYHALPVPDVLNVHRVWHWEASYPFGVFENKKLFILNNL